MTRTLVIVGLLLLAVFLPQVGVPVIVVVLAVLLQATIVTTPPVLPAACDSYRSAISPRAPPSR